MENDQVKLLQHQQVSSLQRGDQLDDEGPAFGEMIAVVMQYKWLIACITALGVVLGGAWSVLVRPVYKADGLIQVEEQTPASMSALKDLGQMLEIGGSTTVATEQEILSSRLVLEKVIERKRLNIYAEPKYFPIVGRTIARHYKGDGVNSPLLGMRSFAWGGEHIQVDAFDVPKSKLDELHVLVLGGSGAFELYDADDELVLKGVVGTRAQSGGYSLFVPQVIGEPGTKFKLIRFSSDTALDLLTKKYTVKERGKKSGIVEVTLKGEDPDQIVSVLHDILTSYVRQNVERHSAEAENTLKFLETQLPIVKRQLDAAEAAYNGYRQNRGSLDLSIETQSVLGSIVDIDNQIVALKQERDELRQYFTPEHPRIQAADAKLEKLHARRVQFDGAVARLPDTQQTVLRLARDVEVYTTLYTDLMNLAQQLRVSKAGTTGDVRIIDQAVAGVQPVSLKLMPLLLIGGFLGFIAGLAAVWIVRMLNVVVHDPEEIESKIGLPVYASIPHSADEAQISRLVAGRKGGEGLLAVQRPDDDAIESLRSLRTTIHFALLDAQQNSLLVSGASPGLGKSFISKNLGAVIGQTGKKAVIVDADLRRGHINKEFGLKREIGVTEYVAGTATIDEIIKPTAVSNLWIITTGQIPPNPSEILMHLRFEELLEALSERFDSVIIDAPPILAVSDAAIIGRHVGATLLVARAGRHPIRELEQAVKRFNQSGVHVKGFVFNDLDTNRQRYRYGYKGYVYRYSYGTKSK